jgi:zinc D-Ala-D-Ala dipeptidase
MTIRQTLCGVGILLGLWQPMAAQQVSFHITPLHPVEQLREAALKAQPPHEHGTLRTSDLVELIRIDPDLKLDIRYATTNNFLRVPVYTQARAFL